MKRIYLLISLITTTLLLFACGGGGGGGDTLTSSISYTGLKTPAVITTLNADILADGMFDFESDPFGLSGLLTIYASKTTTSLPANNSLSQLTVNALRQIDLANTTSLAGAIVTYSETQQCDSGTLYMTADLDTVTGAFDGYGSFNDCVISGLYMDGVVNFYGIGSIDPVTSEFDIIQMTMTFTDMNEIYGTESYTYSGKIVIMGSSPTSIQVTYDQVVRDNNTGTVFMYEDYSLTVADMVSQVEIILSGKFYHPDYGYVDVSTSAIEPIVVIESYEWPTSGIVTATGDSSALEINCDSGDPDTYTFSVDTDGDGLYEVSSTESW